MLINRVRVVSIEVIIRRAGPGWAGPIVGRAKIGLGQN